MMLDGIALATLSSMAVPVPLQCHASASFPQTAECDASMANHDLENDILVRYVRSVQETMGWSQNELARRAGVDPATVSKGTRQSRRTTLRAIERASRIPLPAELALAGEPDFMNPPTVSEREDRVTVYAMLGSPLPGLWYRNEAMPDTVPRPPGLADARAVYAIRMPDGTMLPWRRPNELVFINPTWAVAEGDHVLVETNHPTDPNHPRPLYRVRRYLGASRQGLRFGSYAVTVEDIIPAREHANMFRTLEWSEVLGIR
ncbi:MAG: helix-turn-helix domain-containing protein [Pirellulales bacterium]